MNDRTYACNRIDEYVAKCLELHLVPKYKTIRPGMLQIAITRLPWLSAERVVEYLSRDDLTKCLLASSAAFPICPLIFHRGTWCIDGNLDDRIWYQYPVQLANGITFR